MTFTEAYSILEVSTGATEQDIKSAFRRRAKQLHPDKNNSPLAHAEFLILHEAYALLSEKRTAAFASAIKEKQQEDRMQRAKKAAENYARMKYEEYEREVEMYHNSPYSWLFRILYYGLFLLYLVCAMTFAFIPLYLFSYGIKWFLISCPLWVLSLFTFSFAYSWKKEIDPLFD